MSNKENNDTNCLNDTGEFQTFSKNCKKTFKNNNESQISTSKDDIEFTFKKNLFNNNNKTKEVKTHANKNKLTKEVLNKNIKTKENKEIFKKIFLRKEEKNLRTVISAHNVLKKGENKILESNNSKIKLTLKQKNSSVKFNDKNNNKFPFLQKLSTKAKIKDSSINFMKTKENNKSSFLYQNLKNNYQNNINQNRNFILSYKSKLQLKFNNYSEKNIHTKISEPNLVHKNLFNMNIQSQNNKTLNNQSKEKKGLQKINYKIKNAVKNEKKIGSKIPLAYKNQIKNVLENNSKISKIKINSNHSMINKPNKTILNLKHQNNTKNYSKLFLKNQTKRKLTPDKKIFY